MIVRQLTLTLVLAGLFLAVMTGLRFAESAGWIEAGAAGRGLQVMLGLGFAAYANVMPKQIGAARRSPWVQMHAQAALRVGGWSFTLAGLIYAGLWAFAPLPVGRLLAMASIALALVTTLGYAVWSFTACRRPAQA